MLCCCSTEEPSPKPDRKYQVGERNNNKTVASSRKEPVVTGKPGRSVAGQRKSVNMAANMESLVVRLEQAVSKMEGLVAGATGGGVSDGDGLPAKVAAFDEMTKSHIQTYIQCSNKIGGDVKTHSDMVSSAYAAQRDILIIASKHKQPKPDLLQKLLTPLSSAVSKIQDFREKNRSSKQFNHLSAISEGIPAFGWVAVNPKPGPYVKELSDSGQFYTNRILKEFKEKDATHADWVKAWLQTLTQLQVYIKQHHTTGLTWNPNGMEAPIPKSSAPPPPGGAPPPPPPPPPADLGDSGSSSSGGDPKAALFADLNKGEAVTKGLRKVKEDQKTHKNPALREGPKPFIPNKPSPTPSQKSASAPSTQQKPPRVELDGKKWVVENHNGNRNIVLNDVNIKQTVYIYNCVDSTVQVKGKVNSIVMDSCKKSGLVFENLVASVEFINCKSVQGQAIGKVPTVAIDKTDGCQVYLSKESIEAEIIVAKSSEMNILIPDKSGEFKEYALPEQYKTKYHKGKMVTTPMDSA